MTFVRPPAPSGDHDARMSTSSQLRAELLALHDEVVECASRLAPRTPMADANRVKSRDNLYAYVALRRHDLYELQMALAEEGLSSLGRIESQVLSGLRKVLERLGHVADGAGPSPSAVTAAEAAAILEERSRILLGRPRDGRATRIMVTLDGTVLHDPAHIERLLLAGMDTARINCAHDSPAVWKAIIDETRAAELRLAARGTPVGRSCHVSMDIAGPKIRTGPLGLEPQAHKVKVHEDAGIRVVLDQAATTSQVTEREVVLAVRGDAPLDDVPAGETLVVRDVRGRLAALRVERSFGGGRISGRLDRKVLIDVGVRLESPRGAAWTVTAGVLGPVEVRLLAGDRLDLYRDPHRIGHPAGKDGPAGIACTLPDALANVAVGHRVFIDDAKLGFVVESVETDRLVLRTTHPTGDSARLQPGKGLNFPDTLMRLSSITPEDHETLPFLAAHADAVALSFVHQPTDIVELRDALVALGRPQIGIIAKIETREALHNLASLLLVGLQLPSFGVMIARGDLAVEVGFEDLAFVQEDILCLCEAAHVPVIWATQVLETLAHSGLPARAELTDAAAGQRADCVMLNKGPHIVRAVEVLSSLLRVAARHRVKKREVFREFTEQTGLLDDPA